MRRKFSWVGIATVLLAVAAPTQAEEYLVVLTDGSWVRAAEKPILVDGRARVELEDGLVAVIEGDRIDWNRSDEWNRWLTSAVPEIAQVFPVTGDPLGEAIDVVGEAGDAGERPEQVEVPLPPPPDPYRVMRLRIASMEVELQDLLERKRALDRRILRTIDLDEVPALRRQVQELEAGIRAHRREISDLILRLPPRSLP